MMPRNSFWLVGSILLLLFTAATAAAIPDPPHASMPAFLKVGGKTTPTGAPDPSIAFTVSLRDYANNPIQNANIVLDFGACTDTKICSATVGLDCSGGQGAAPIVSGLTDANGLATFFVLGAAMNWGDDVHCPPSGSPPTVLCPGAGLGCVAVYADGALLGRVTAVTFDQDGSITSPGGVNAVDFSRFKVDVTGCNLTAPRRYVGRSDFDGNGSVTAADISHFKTILANGLSAAGCMSGGMAAPFCP
jgi:hypothetical protein